MSHHPSRKSIGEVPISGKTFAAELVPAISSLLGEAGLNVADLDAVAVVRGPGSFTGVRIGVSAAKGLVGAAIPLVAFSRLEVLTRKAGIAVSASPSSMRGEANTTSASTRQGIACWSR